VVSGPGKLTSASTGDRVADVLAGTASDVDLGTVLGFAIIGSSGSGRWQYSHDGGTTWADLGAVSASQAHLLGPNDRVRFLPAAARPGVHSICSIPPHPPASDPSFSGDQP